MAYYRRLPKFEYLAPKSVEEALSLLKQHQGEARIMAGGTITIHNMKERIGVRKYLLSLKSIPDFDGIGFEKGSGLRIGPMATLQSLADSPMVNEKYATFAEVCRRLATPPIRNMGTIGGNVACRFPTAETVPALVGYNARATVANAAEQRSVPLEALFRELKSDEMITEISLPVPSAGMRGGYEKFSMRERIDYATVSAVALVEMERDVCAQAKVVMGGVTLATMRSRSAEDALTGNRVTDETIAQAAAIAAEGCKTGSDLQASAEYKKQLLKVMVERALRKALNGGVR